MSSCMGSVFVWSPCKFVKVQICYLYMTTCSVSEVLPTGQLSNVPWRRMGVKYTNNEAYFDVIEEIDAIIDKSGSTVFAEIQGYVSCMQRGGLMQPVKDDLKTLISMYNAT